jgi:Mrp family chromosome partitioning ATPase
MMSSKTEMNTADRITRYLLRRLERKAIRDVYERAEARGLLERKRVPSAAGGEIIAWQVPQTLPDTLTGHFRTDGLLIERTLARPVPPDPDPMADLSMGEDLTIGHTVDGTPVHAVNATSSLRDNSTTKEDRDALERAASAFGGDYLLLLIRSCRAKPHVADAAVALLIARAIGETVPDLGCLLDVLRRPASVIVLQTAVAEFEQRVGRMLERGLIMPFPLSLVDAFGDRALSGRYRDQESDRHRVMTMSGKGLRDMSAQAIRDALAKASLHKTMPLFIADELASAEFPPRLAAAADLVLQTGGIDRTLLAELLHVCLSIPPKTSLTTMEVRDFQPGALGLDDLALALRPGRSVEEILTILTALTAATDAERQEENEGSGDGSGRSRKLKPRGRERLGRLTRAKGDGASELTMPEPQSTDAEQKPSTMKYLTVETLSGYGQAKDWALDLKADLSLWRQGSLAWSDMSTKLLLSGPPGTGKTTFARALCNTLQVPLLATSLATMLEPGYLGDVLKSMTSVFETASDQAPAILFIDEFENIGKRSGGGDKNAEYWNSVVNRMLELLDGANRTEGVIVVAATNFSDRIDGALLRSGRLETRIDIPLPDTTALAGILEHHLGSDLAAVIGTRPRSSPRMQAETGKLGPAHALQKLGRSREGRPRSDLALPSGGVEQKGGLA